MARIECTACGATADAACECGVAYVPAGVRAAKAIADNPEKSNRAIAAEIGVSEPTVRRARGASDDAPETVTGRDGKSYPAKQATCSFESPGFCGAAPEFIKPAAAYVGALGAARDTYLKIVLALDDQEQEAEIARLLNVVKVSKIPVRYTPLTPPPCAPTAIPPPDCQ
jgi:hypothetical protein